MCRFKSGIILKTKCVVTEGSNDSHTDLLDELGIEDTEINAMTRFVRAELLPPNDEWWTDPDTWKISIDQDIVPDWFKEDEERYLFDFKSAVKDWWNVHVLVDKKIDELSTGYYRLQRCEVKRLLKAVQVMLDNSSVQRMYNNSSVQKMYNNSSVQRMYGRSSVQVMLNNSSVQEMYDNSSVQRMYGNSIARDYSTGIIHISGKAKLRLVVHENMD